MNAREKLLLVVLIAILVLGIGGYLTNEQFLKPLWAADSKVSGLESDINDAMVLLAKYNKDKPRLDAARKRSLPSNPELAVSLYNIEYLQPLLRKSGLTVESVTPSGASDVALAVPVGEIKKTGHKRLTFQIRARGELGQLVNAIRTIQATPYEHRIKNLQVDRTDAKDSTKLAISMMVEILLVANADKKTAAPPPEPDFKSLPDRDYDDIAKKNIFVGAVPRQDVIVWKMKDPPKVAPPVEVPVVETGPEPPAENVPEFIRLVTTDPESKTAYLRNILYGTRENKLIARSGSGFEFFKITDEVGDYVFFKAKILRVDQREAYFQVKNQVYKLHIGSSLQEARDLGGLSIDQIEDAGLFDVYDREWAKKEMEDEKEKTKTPTKKSGKSR